MTDTKTIAEWIMSEIQRNREDGVLPMTARIATFADLHDYVDANEYVLDAGTQFGFDPLQELDLCNRIVDDVNTEILHSRCHATYFNRCDEMGVFPMLDDLFEFENDQFTARVFREMKTVALWWTDGVANDWCQQCSCEANAMRLLLALVKCSEEGRTFTDEELAQAMAPPTEDDLRTKIETLGELLKATPVRIEVQRMRWTADCDEPEVAKQTFRNEDAAWAAFHDRRMACVGNDSYVSLIDHSLNDSPLLAQGNAHYWSNHLSKDADGYPARFDNDGNPVYWLTGTPNDPNPATRTERDRRILSHTFLP